MAIHHPTPSLGGGERPRLPSAPRFQTERRSGGPVTQANRAMRANVPAENIRDQIIPSRNVYSIVTEGIRTLSRAEVEDLIGSLIDLLDAMDGDPDLEDGHDAEGNTDDNGFGDSDAPGEQGFLGYGGWL